MHKDLSLFSDAQLAAVIEAEAFRHERECTPASEPHAVLLAGQPGAGKTELSTMIMKSFPYGGCAFINGDDYRRLHPNYRQLYKEHGSDSVTMTSKFSSMVTEAMIARLSDLRVNLIVEGTGRTVEVPKITSELLSEKGYKVELAVIAARPEISLISTLLRFYHMNEGGTIPRATAREAHDKVVNCLPGNLDTLKGLPSISRITIWDRELNQLYDSRIHEVEPSTVLTGFWDRPWPEEEIQKAKETVEILRQKELVFNLGQMATIEELACRIDDIEYRQMQMQGMTLL